MLRKPEEDLFDSTKMSFGEHLEELRSALIKAIAVLVVGVLIGFLPGVGNGVVRYIQTPLQGGLQEFRKQQSKEEFDRYIKELRASGQEVPDDLAQAAERYEQEGLVPRVWRVDPRDLIAALRSLGIEVGAPDDGAPNDGATEDGAPLGLAPLVLWSPLDDDPRTRTIGTGIPDAFLVWLKAAFLVGVVISSPFVFYFLWAFVASGLYPHEQRYVYVFMPFSIGLFLAGAALAFFGVFPFVLNFLFGYYEWLEIDPTPRIGEWLNFALLLPVGFGLGFQLPLVMLFLERIGVFSLEDYQKSWRIGVLVIFIASMLLTP
ncbi:MAG: twin-arginine translocase subunit TatC, partial [Planctomycetota bacterium]